MCNSYETRGNASVLVEMLEAQQLPLAAAPPIFAAADTVRPTDVAPIVRRGDGGLELVLRRWGFAPARPKAGPVINVRSERRAFDHHRCLIPATSFFEFTGTRSPKTRWRFTTPDAPWFCVAGLWRRGPDERFTMLTTAPGPVVAPYHDRQIVILPPAAWSRWLAPDPLPADWLATLPLAPLVVAPAAP